ncbi:hypothetical protein LTR70_006328 [Exophiala xenobiotica]|uniref:Uncharacterized protein n=1 Tax=Lithohypha guttulata TaxID=1690604 RepID=A0ABR0K881_9EURO|nr:hypothetical protein LTR24_005797 [Lithohypha guttulata]KAK5316273.1 hypothetical protein LTR70_006328 [Exophiala xenobiotica]
MSAPVLTLTTPSAPEPAMYIGDSHFDPLPFYEVLALQDAAACNLKQTLLLDQVVSQASTTCAAAAVRGLPYPTAPLMSSQDNSLRERGDLCFTTSTFVRITAYVPVPPYKVELVDQPQRSLPGPRDLPLSANHTHAQ